MYSLLGVQKLNGNITMIKIAILSGAFFIVSLFFSMLGMGGGMFYVPILLFAKFPMHDAAAISLTLILATSVSALFVFLKNKMVDWKLAAIIDPPTDIMAFVCGVLFRIFFRLFFKSYPCLCSCRGWDVHGQEGDSETALPRGEIMVVLGQKF